MTLQAYKKSLSAVNPPATISVYLKALWYDAKDNWQEAHKIIQVIQTQKASWIHAYLHRKEGDIFNADYWYSKAGKVRPAYSINEEWENIVAELL